MTNPANPQIFENYESVDSLNWDKEKEELKAFRTGYMKQITLVGSNFIKTAMELDDTDVLTTILESKVVSKLLKQNKYIEDGKKELKERKCADHTIMITISPIDNGETSADDLVELCEKICAKKWLKSIRTFFTIEQRGKDEENRGKGLHAHLCFVKYGMMSGGKTRGKNEILKDLISTSKSFLGNNIEDQGIDIRGHFKFVKDTDKLSIDMLLEYCTGKKKEEKMDAVVQDHIYRKEMNIKSIYGIKLKVPTSPIVAPESKNKKKIRFKKI